MAQMNPKISAFAADVLGRIAMMPGVTACTPNPDRHEEGVISTEIEMEDGTQVEVLFQDAT
jgi:hypothetical protein